jgi:hypothetical protein
VDEFPANFFFFFILAGYSKFEEQKKYGKTSGPRTDGSSAGGDKKGGPLQSLRVFVTHEHHGGKNYPNFANATASPPTCVMP